MRTKTQQDGITLLITLLLMGIFLGISASLLNITLKQFQLSGITAASEIAFQAANAGMECALYNDLKASGSEFDVPEHGTGEQSSRPSIRCMDHPGMVQSEDRSNGIYIDNNGNGLAISGGEQWFEFNWGDPEVCSQVSIYKFFNPENSGVEIDLLVDGVDMRPNKIGPPPEDGDCQEGAICTVVQARGYNVACDNIEDNPKVVEREYTQVYDIAAPDTP